MELRHLRYFVAVAEEQSVTRAALRLNITQQPLNRQIRDLEAELRVRLFERNANQIQLTAAGRLYLEESIDILSRVEAATRRVRALPDGPRSSRKRPPAV